LTELWSPLADVLIVEAIPPAYTAFCAFFFSAMLDAVSTGTDADAWAGTGVAATAGVSDVCVFVVGKHMG
jgi:hypothetical protein